MILGTDSNITFKDVRREASNLPLDLAVVDDDGGVLHLVNAGIPSWSSRASMYVSGREIEREGFRVLYDPPKSRVVELYRGVESIGHAS